MNTINTHSFWKVSAHRFIYLFSTLFAHGTNILARWLFRESQKWLSVGKTFWIIRNDIFMTKCVHSVCSFWATPYQVGYCDKFLIEEYVHQKTRIMSKWKGSFIVYNRNLVWSDAYHCIIYCYSRLPRTQTINSCTCHHIQDIYTHRTVNGL